MNPFVLFAHKVSALASGMIEKIVRLMAEPVIRITGVPWDESKWESLFQFVKFCMIGVSNVLVSYSIDAAQWCMHSAVYGKNLRHISGGSI